MTRITVIFPLVLFLAFSLPRPAPAISVELAKKCRAMAIEAYATKLAGSKSGNAAAQRRYYSECVSKNGVMTNDESPKDQSTPAK